MGVDLNRGRGVARVLQPVLCTWAPRVRGSTTHLKSRLMGSSPPAHAPHQEWESPRSKKHQPYLPLHSRIVAACLCPWCSSEMPEGGVMKSAHPRGSFLDVFLKAS